MKKTIQNTVKFNKLLEKIHQLLVKKIHDQPISYNDIVDINSRANSLFDMYMNNKLNGKRTQATPPTLSVRG
jgi:hypothetical protein